MMPGYRVACLLGALIIGVLNGLAIEPVNAAERGSTLVLSGVIGPGAFARFKAELDRRNPDVIVVDGPGGRVFEAMLIGTEIKRRGLSTVVPKSRSCASACTIVFLSGRTRALETGATLGLHAASSGGGAADRQGNALMYTYLNRVGMHKSMAREMAAVPPGEMRWLTGSETRALGIRSDR
jgi:hypothetical protein